MSKQNIYDNDAFFESFKKIRSSEVNFNDMIEAPILLSMLPDIQGKSVLDIGCGMGQHAKQYADMGAGDVLGIDISEKMLAYARAHNFADNISYCHMAMEDISGLDREFDVVTSSLAFDYIKDFDGLMNDINSVMRSGAYLVFSMSHPMSTAYDGRYPKYTRNEHGDRIYANISNYFVEGKRTITWVVDNYELYHRTFSTLLNTLIKAGFSVDECRESQTSDELRAKYPEKFGGTLHRPDFIFFKYRK